MLDHVRQGAGEPLVLIHGIGSQWQAWTFELARRGVARSVTALSPLGFARGREVTFARRSLVGSRALARALAPATGALLATGAGRTLLQSQFFARPWRVPAAAAAEATRNLATSSSFHATLPLLATEQRGDLQVPVTIAWGARDRLLIPRQAGRARQAMPGARHECLAGCGHVPVLG